MPYALGGTGFVGFVALIRWGLHQNWPLAIITGLLWAVALGSLMQAARDRRFAGVRMSGYFVASVALTTAAAQLGVSALDLPAAEERLAAGLMVLGVGFAGVTLGMLGAVIPGRRQD
ncbi:MAG: hypothetical protein AB2385_03985 [Symbiobacterium sp.]|uniref:hypothetical protein n=1 Tax=Symbiobacterium sp. TaxID=1971213 RepID=UPI003464DD1B